MHTFWNIGWQVIGLDVKKKGCQDGSLCDANLEASCVRKVT